MRNYTYKLSAIAPVARMPHLTVFGSMLSIALAAEYLVMGRLNGKGVFVKEHMKWKSGRCIAEARRATLKTLCD